MPDTTTQSWFCPQVDEATGWRCPSASHDTYSARRHGCRSPAAIDDRRIYMKRRVEGRSQPRQHRVYVGLTRRIQAATFMGWPDRELAECLGISRATLYKLAKGQQGFVTEQTRARLTGLLDRVAMTPGPSQRTRNHARRQGFRPLLAWDDIDDPAEQPPPAPDLADQIAELAARGLNRLQVARKLDVGEKVVRRHWPEVAVDVDVNIVDAVRTGRRHLSECSDPEAELVVETVYRGCLSEGWPEPGVTTAELLDVDYAVVRLIWLRIVKRRRPVKESP